MPLSLLLRWCLCVLESCRGSLSCAGGEALPGTPGWVCTGQSLWHPWLCVLIPAGQSLWPWARALEWPWLCVHIPPGLRTVLVALAVCADPSRAAGQSSWPGCRCRTLLGSRTVLVAPLAVCADPSCEAGQRSWHPWLCMHIPPVHRIVLVALGRGSGVALAGRGRAGCSRGAAEVQTLHAGTAGSAPCTGALQSLSQSVMAAQPGHLSCCWQEPLGSSQASWEAGEQQ